MAESSIVQVNAVVIDELGKCSDLEILADGVNDALFGGGKGRCEGVIHYMGIVATERRMGPGVEEADGKVSGVKEFAKVG